MKKCKKCGTLNHPDEIFCTNCGENLMRKEYLVSDEKKPAENKAEQPELKHTQDDDVVIIPDENNSEEELKPRKSKKKLLIIILVIVGVLLIAGAAVASYFMFFWTPEKPTKSMIISAMNDDENISKIKVGDTLYDFKVSELKINKESLDKQKYHCYADVTRECEVYGIAPVMYKINFVRDGSTFRYSKSETADNKTEFYALSGVDRDTADAKVKKYCKDAEFKEQKTDIDKGVDLIYYTVNTDEYDGIVSLKYKFSTEKGWVFKKYSDKKLEFKKGITHKEDGLYTNSNVKNILFLGVDSDSGVGRSDCMMLISVDANTGKIKQTSFMRDNWFEIPGHGTNKLNAAFALGGPKLTMQTIGNTFGIKIDKYVCVSFQTFKDVINNLGGVDVKITPDEAGYINWQLNKNGQANSVGLVSTAGGVTHLNGQQALWLCRDRGGNGYSGNDFVRTARQRRVIQSLVSTYKNYTPSKVLSTLNILKKNVKTNLTKKDFKWFAERSPRFFKFKFKQRCVPGDGEWQSGTSSGGAWIIQINDFKKLKKDIQTNIYEDLK
jgi:LCP family protein required for cell wall assembly